jgi:hypothetical protein
LFLTALLPGSLLYAQNDSSSDAFIYGPIYKDEVLIPFTVTDKKSNFVTDLHAYDLSVFDNHKPAKIISFIKQGERPFRLGLLLDASRSARDTLRLEQEASENFVRGILPSQP